MTWCVFPDLSLWNDLRKPGSYSSKPGSYSSKRRSCSSKPESYFSKPGSYSSKPWSYSSKPGSCFWKFTPHYSPKFLNTYFKLNQMVLNKFSFWRYLSQIFGNRGFFFFFFFFRDRTSLLISSNDTLTASKTIEGLRYVPEDREDW